MSLFDEVDPIEELEGWVDTLLAERSLDDPDGRPLYGYRVTQRSLDTLASPLCGALLEPEEVVLQYKRTIGAALCIYAAEWWRRNHGGGAWKWEGILSDLQAPNYRPGELRYPVLQTLVESGLEFWGVDLLETGRGRGFLLTLACQGGLPLQLVRRGHGQGRIRRYFRLLLQELSLPGHEQVEPVRLARRVDRALPGSLRQEVVFQLAGDLAASIRRLQSRLEGSDFASEDPIEALNQLVPGWQDRLPLRLDDNVAKALLRNLIADATEVSRQAAERIRWRRTLSRTGTSWSLQALVEVPSRLRCEALFNLFGIPQNARQPSYADLFMRSEEGVSERVARGRRAGGTDDSYYRLVPLGAASSPVRGEIAAAGIQLKPGGSLARYATRSALVEGGAGLSELPWVFEGPEGSLENSNSIEELKSDNGASFEFIGEGSIKTKKSSVLAVLPSGAEVEVRDRDSLTERVGTLPRVKRDIVLCSGSILVHMPDGEEHVIKTGAPDADTRSEFILDGEVVSLDRGKVPLFSTLRMRAVSPDLGSRSIHHSSWEWRPAHGAGWRPWRSSHFGEGRLRVREEGRVRADRKVRLLPPDASIKVELPKAGGQQGRLRLDGFASHGPCKIVVEGEDAKQAEVKLSSDGSITVGLPVRPDRDSVRLTAFWGEQRLSLHLPYPAEWVAFIASDGRRIRPGEQLPVNRLSGIRAMGFSLRHRPRLEARFLAPKGVTSEISGGQVWHTPVHVVPGAFDLYSVDLLATGLSEWVRERLEAAVTDQATVRLILEVPQSGTHVRKEVSVGHFDLAFDIEQDRNVLRLRRGPTGDFIETAEADRLDVSSLQLWGGEGLWGVEDELEREDALEILPEWHLPESYGTTAEESLIFATEGSLHRAFPYLWRPGGDEDLRNNHRLLVRQLSEMPLSPAWATQVESLVQMLGDVPAQAFPLLRALKESPQALALSALLLPSVQQEEGWQNMEGLGFLWMAIPVKSWLDALDTIGPLMRKGTLPVEVVMPSLELLLERLPGLKIPVLRWRVRELGLGMPSELAETTRLDSIDEEVRQTNRAQEAVRASLTGGLKWCPVPNSSPLLQRLEHLNKRGGLASGLLDQRHAVEDRRHYVLNAPVMLGLSATEGKAMSPSEAFFIRIVRNRFPDGFESAVEGSMNAMLARQWAREKAQHEGTS